MAKLVDSEKFNQMTLIWPTFRLGRVFRAQSLKEVLLNCDRYTPGDPPTLFFDRNGNGFNTILDIYR